MSDFEGWHMADDTPPPQADGPPPDPPSAFMRALDEAVTGRIRDTLRAAQTNWSQSKTFTIEDLNRAIAELTYPKRVLVVCPQDEPKAREFEERLREVNIVEIRASQFVLPGTAYVVLHPDELPDTFLSPIQIHPDALRERVRFTDIDIVP